MSVYILARNHYVYTYSVSFLITLFSLWFPFNIFYVYTYVRVHVYNYAVCL